MDSLHAEPASLRIAKRSGTDVSHDERWDLDLLRGAVRYQRWVLGSFEGWLHGRVLEVGAGNGNFTRWIAGSASSLVVAEPNPEMCAEIAVLNLDRVEVRCEAIQGLFGETFDSIVMLNVLEHIEDDHEALLAAKELLPSGGALCLLVPAHPSLYGSLDRHYDHFRRYAKHELSDALRNAGFEVRTCRYFNPLGAVGWWFVARAFRRRRLPRSAVVLSERVGVPVGKLFRAPRFGQSVLAVAVKP